MPGKPQVCKAKGVKGTGLLHLHWNTPVCLAQLVSLTADLQDLLLALLRGDWVHDSKEFGGVPTKGH